MKKPVLASIAIGVFNALAAVTGMCRLGGLRRLPLGEL
jgi:hypothetical protein